MDVQATDEELLAAFVRGDRAALGELARRHEPHLLGLAMGLLGGCPSAARDAVQETWLRVIKHAAGFNGRSSLKTWLYRIAINRCRDLRGRTVAHCARGAHPAETDDADPGQSTMHGEDLGVLRQAVSNLTPVKQEVLLLCYHEGMTHEQVAVVLEMPVGTVKSRLHAALQELREQLANEVKR